MRRWWRLPRGGLRLERAVKLGFEAGNVLFGQFRNVAQNGLFDFRFLLDGQGGDDAREIAAIMVEALRLLAVVPHVGWDGVQKEQTTKSGPLCLERHVHLLHMV